ncbi:MAG: YceI family protein [Gammaproteobacteria bacterium]|nr:YceI family protein [Gammaproteobacteria bacterium]NIR97701.1 YceI family protein [Gammaproteobacteria bacterium]NIT62894.1 YceI family protein [Gammaproteobacteria bacterium]NIV19859.1 YceI family protein [Gammaproteobacteria bacterium]NIX11372.1 YceI family protein [Gammaproteobacteria bacterium]
MKTRLLSGTVLAAVLLVPGLAPAADYAIDTKKAHAFIQFRIKHLGYSWLLGRFNDFGGSFSYDEDNPQAARVEVVIDTASIDTNFAERDKHLRSDDFLDVAKYPEARFVSTGFTPKDDGLAVLTGDLTLHGVTRPVTIAVKEVGHGPDPWGGFRRGFEGTTTLKLADFGIDHDLGPASREVELFFSIEGIRQ